MQTIALDAMGGDHGPEVVVPAALKVLRERQELKLILVGDEEKLNQVLSSSSFVDQQERLIVRHASQVVAMDEPPALALRNKKDSSMRVAINLVKNGEASACVSAGNTGALMATARFVLKMIPGIDRPAIVYAMPTMDFDHPESIENQRVYMLDLGANVDCSSEHLLQFAIMGSVLVAAVRGVERPRVALLNNGAEAIKGNEQVKEANQLLSQSHSLNYIGYAEGDDIYRAKADVIVCDGFVGNVALKVSEGVAKVIGLIVKSTFEKNWMMKLCGVSALPALKQIRRSLDMTRYNGASFLGLRGIVIKSHGGASVAGFATAIEEAVAEAKQNVPGRISVEVEKLLAEAN